MDFYIKNNNNKGMQNQVSYYHSHPEMNHNDWLCDINRNFAGICQNLWLTGTKNQSFVIPEQGDIIFIYQRVHNTPQIVTHVLQFIDNKTTTLQKQFPKNALLTLSLSPWPIIRQTQIIAVLQPSAFNASSSSDLLDLQSQKDPTKAITLSKILNNQTFPCDGKIYKISFTYTDLSLFKNNECYDYCENEV